MAQISWLLVLYILAHIFPLLLSSNFHKNFLYLLIRRQEDGARLLEMILDVLNYLVEDVRGEGLLFHFM